MFSREETIKELDNRANEVRAKLDRISPATLTLPEAVNLCFQCSYARGWWHHLDTLTLNENRNKAEMIALIHSEVSEAYGSYGQDDKLPDFDAEVVELADALIRVFDFVEGIECRNFVPELLNHTKTASFSESVEKGLPTLERITYSQMYATLHYILSAAMEAVRKDTDPSRVLAVFTVHVFECARQQKYDLVGAFVAKLKYNMSRKDHDLGERLKTGGKKF